MKFKTIYDLEAQVKSYNFDEIAQEVYDLVKDDKEMLHSIITQAIYEMAEEVLQIKTTIKNYEEYHQQEKDPQS